MKCSIDGCENAMRSLGWCNRHYTRWRAHGDPLVMLARLKGTGSLTAKGYVVRTLHGVAKLEHVRIAEQALGRAIPLGAVVHHVNEDKADNAPRNLVICPDETYHQLLHQRQRAFDACGHYDWRKCSHCKQYDAPENLSINAHNQPKHPECRRRYMRTYYSKQKEVQ